MKTPWAWMVVMVALDSGPVVALGPYETLAALSMSWVPLATAEKHPARELFIEYSIRPNSPNSFDVIFPVDSYGNCVNTWRAIVPDEEETFVISGKKDKIRFLDTNYRNYHIVSYRKGSDLTLLLYAPCRLPTYY